MKSLILHQWQAKSVALVLAAVLWVVIRRNIEATTSPSRFQFEADEKFQFDTSRYGNPAKK